MMTSESVYTDEIGPELNTANDILAISIVVIYVIFIVYYKII